MTDYKLLCRTLESLTDTVPYAITNLSNTCALLFQSLENLNWAGFYFVKDGSLVLYPFQGKTACTKIAPGKGVCGTAAKNDEILSIPDVHKFPGHIACDSASQSEIVIPLHYENRVIGVLDIDSPLLSRFDKNDEQGLSQIALITEKFISKDSEFLSGISRGLI